MEFTTGNAMLDLMVHALGMTPHEWNCERARFELSPRKWMQERIAKLGYVPASVVEKLIAVQGKDAA